MRMSSLLSCAVFFVILGTAGLATGRAPGKNVDPSKGVTPGWITNDKLATGEVVVAKVCVVPAEGQWSRLGLKGSEGMSKEADPWSEKLLGIVESHLKGIGVTIASTGISAADLEADEQLQQTVLQLQRKYDSVDTKMRDKIKDVKKSRYTLGDEVALLPCSANSDALAFVRGEGVTPTGGEKTKYGLLGLFMSSAATLRVTFVDAKSGEVLAYSLMYGAGGKTMSDPEAVFGKQLDKDFKEIGIGPNAKSKKKK